MAVPVLSADERRANMERARIARAARAKFRSEIANGEISADDAVARRSDPVIGRMRVRDFIKAFRGYGDTRTEALMAKLGISYSRRLAGLGDRQAEKLVEALS